MNTDQFLAYVKHTDGLAAAQDMAGILAQAMLDLADDHPGAVIQLPLPQHLPSCEGTDMKAQLHLERAHLQITVWLAGMPVPDRMVLDYQERSGRDADLDVVGMDGVSRVRSRIPK